MVIVKLAESRLPGRPQRSGKARIPMYSGTKTKEGKRLTMRSECVLQRWQIYHNIAPLSCPEVDR